MSNLDAAQLLRINYNAGFRGSALINMTAIQLAESGGNPGAVNNNPGTGDLSYGISQINMYGNLGPARLKQYSNIISTPTDLLNPLNNARIAYSLSNHGKSFTPWSTYKNNAYRHYLSTVETAYQQNKNYLGGNSLLTFLGSINPPPGTGYNSTGQQLTTSESQSLQSGANILNQGAQDVGLPPIFNAFGNSSVGSTIDLFNAILGPIRSIGSLSDWILKLSIPSDFTRVAAGIWGSVFILMGIVFVAKGTT